MSELVSESTFAASLAVMVLLTVGIAHRFRVGLGLQPLVALARAAVQLGVVAALLRGVLSVPWTVVAFTVLMLTTASWTAGGRITAIRGGRRVAALGVVSGAGVALLLAFGLRLVGTDPQHVVAVAGIVIGGSMNAATLAGRRFAQNAALRRDEVEGWLALGAQPEEAYEDVSRVAVHEALLPNLDQTRATGLVTLPGAFVGALFGGAGPVEAAKFQLVVLAAILLAMLVCGLVVTRLASRLPYVYFDAAQ